MPLNPSLKGKLTLSKLNCSSVKKKEGELILKVDKFLSLIFQSVEEEIQEELVAKFITSLFEEAQNEILISKFVDSVLIDAKKEVDAIKNKFNITRNMQELDSKKEKNISQIPKKNNAFNGETSYSNKKIEEKNKNICAKRDKNSSLKCRKVLFSDNKLPAISNMNTIYKENTEGNRFTSKSSFKNKRNYRINKKDIRNKSHFSVQFKTRRVKEKKQCEEKEEIKKKNISMMKRPKEEISNKISSLKHKEDKRFNIKKEKSILKKTLTYNIQKNNSELSKIYQDKDIKKSSGKSLQEKTKNHRQIKEEKKEHNNKMKTLRQENNNNVKRLIQKIRALRAFNKDIIPKRKKIMINKNKINAKECEKNMEFTYFPKKQIRLLKNKEYNYVDKLKRTNAKLFNYGTVEKSYSTVTSKLNKSGKGYKINW